MKYDPIIKHISINAVTYIDEYSKKDIITDREKGILMGLWLDLDSIKNQLLVEEEDTTIDLEKLMNDLDELINK